MWKYEPVTNAGSNLLNSLEALDVFSYGSVDILCLRLVLEVALILPSWHHSIETNVGRKVHKLI